MVRLGLVLAFQLGLPLSFWRPFIRICLVEAFHIPGSLEILPVRFLDPARSFFCRQIFFRQVVRRIYVLLAMPRLLPGGGREIWRQLFGISFRCGWFSEEAYQQLR